jgi:hypothetical protein
MPPRRKPPKKSQAPASRVHKIGSREQWDAMLKKAGDKRLVIVQFYQASVWTCKQMRPYFVRFSVQPKFRKAIFAEVDADMCEVRQSPSSIALSHCYPPTAAATTAHPLHPLFSCRTSPEGPASTASPPTKPTGTARTWIAMKEGPWIS